jgi:hypothetical protein
MLAGTTVPLLPAAVPAVENKEWTVARLIGEMDKMFRCRDGDPRSFMELHKGTHGVRWVELAEEYGEYGDILRVHYATYAMGIEGGDAKEAESCLAKYFYDNFKEYAAGSPLLYWRTKPEFRSDEIVRYGETWMTAEEIEDGAWKRTPVVGTKRWHYDPNKPLEIPEGVAHDIDTGAYRYVTERVQLHTIRMRLAIPKCAREELQRIEKAEGAPVPRI